MVWIGFIGLGAVILTIAVAAMRGKLDLLSMPFFTAVVFFIVYFWFALAGVVSGRVFEYLNQGQVAWGLIVPTAALMAFCFGWFVLGQRARIAGVPRRQPDPVRLERLYWVGAALVGMGLGLWLYVLVRSGGVISFYSVMHGDNQAYAKTFSAWMYRAMWITYPGTACMLLSVLTRSGRKTLWWLGFAAAVVILYADAVLRGDRSDFFMPTATLVATVLLVKRVRPRPIPAFAAMGVLVVGAVLLVTYRPVLHLGATRSGFRQVRQQERLRQFTFRCDRRTQFTQHAAVLATVDANKRHGGGWKYMEYPLTQPIPRLWWPTKPYGSDWDSYYSSVIETHLGWRPSAGWLPTLVADWYREWGMLSLIAWCLLGWVCRYLYQLAVAEPLSPMAVLLYALLLGRGLNLLTQDWLHGLFKPYLMMAVPMALGYWMSGWRRPARRAEAVPRDA